MTDPKQMSDEELAQKHLQEARSWEFAARQDPPGEKDSPALQAAAFHRETARRLRSGVAGRVPEGTLIHSIAYSPSRELADQYLARLQVVDGMVYGTGPTIEAAVDDASRKAMGE